jgi:hypothetical protein
MVNLRAPFVLVEKSEVLILKVTGQLSPVPLSLVVLIIDCYQYQFLLKVLNSILSPPPPPTVTWEPAWLRGRYRL